MEARVRWGLEDGVVDHDQLAAIADTAAGDARIALSILRIATRQTTRQNTITITDDIIEAAGTSRDRTYRSVSESFDYIE